MYKTVQSKIVLHLIVVPQLSSGWQHNYSTKTRQADWANELSMYSLCLWFWYWTDLIVHNMNLFQAIFSLLESEAAGCEPSTLE
jgi:hypothetical protein